MILNKYFLEETPRDESKRTISTGTDKRPFICSATACDRHGITRYFEHSIACNCSPSPCIPIRATLSIERRVSI